jgi:hypothetical protein
MDPEPYQFGTLLGDLQYRGDYDSLVVITTRRIQRHITMCDADPEQFRIRKGNL